MCSFWLTLCLGGGHLSSLAEKPVCVCVSVCVPRGPFTLWPGCSVEFWPTPCSQTRGGVQFPQAQGRASRPGLWALAQCVFRTDPPRWKRSVQERTCQVPLRAAKPPARKAVPPRAAVTSALDSPPAVGLSRVQGRCFLYFARSFQLLSLGSLVRLELLWC